MSKRLNLRAVTGDQITPQPLPDATLEVMHLWIAAAYLEAYAAWLALDPVEKQVYPMPQQPVWG